MSWLKPFPEGRRFKKGERPANWRPVGSEYIKSDGQVMVKVAEPSVWRLKYQVVWEAVNGPLPKGSKLAFADGDQRNVALDNLVVVHRPTIGDEKVGDDGLIHVKVAEPNKWKLKHYILWEESFGPVPKNHKILFIDGRPGNCCLENLVMVPKKENWRLKDIFAGAGAHKKLMELCNGKKHLAAPALESSNSSKPARSGCYKYPVGGERITKNNRVQIKDSTNRWHLKHRMVWEAAHGPIPKGFQIRFIDGNPQNCQLENLTLFKLQKLAVMARSKPIGTEVVRKTRNSVRVKVKASDGTWRLKHHVVWEAAHGPIPRGWCCHFIDGNPMNCQLENLTLLYFEEICGNHGKKSQKLAAEARSKPIGTEVVHKTGNTVRVKVKISDGTWRYKHHVVWEAAHGPVPKGFQLRFIDGNPLNCALENLHIASPSERTRRPVGFESRSGKDYIIVKVAEPDVWKLKHHVVWEEANGPIPDGHVVCFADNNGQNCDLKNLFLLSKEECIQRLHLGRQLVFDDPDLSKSISHILKLGSSIKKIKQNADKEDPTDYLNFCLTKSHKTQREETLLRIHAAVTELQRSGQDVTKARVAAMVGLNRTYMNQHYGKYFIGVFK